MSISCPSDTPKQKRTKPKWTLTLGSPEAVVPAKGDEGRVPPERIWKLFMKMARRCEQCADMDQQSATRHLMQIEDDLRIILDSGEAGRPKPKPPGETVGERRLALLEAGVSIEEQAERREKLHPDRIERSIRLARERRRKHFGQ